MNIRPTGPGDNHNLPPNRKSKAAWRLWESLHPFHRATMIAAQWISLGIPPWARLRCPKCRSDQLTFGAAGLVTPMGSTSTAELVDRLGHRHIIAGLPVLGIESDRDTITVYRCDRGHIIIDSISFVRFAGAARSLFVIDHGISGMAGLFAEGSGASS